jgi:hypothetical protein
LLLDVCLDHDGEFGGGALDARAELGRAPVLRRGVDRGREGEGAHVGEQWAHLVVNDQRVAWRASGRCEQHRLGDDQVVVEDVEEGLEQATDAGLVDGSGGDDRVGDREPVDGCLDRLAGESGDGGPRGCRRRAARVRSRWPSPRSRPA